MDLGARGQAASHHWRWWVLAFWVIAAIVLLIVRWQAVTWFSLPDTDDNMRMSQVRALLAGQDWYDLRQYKLNPPIGYDIHWSRVVDLPLAALILIIKPFAGTVIAEKSAVAIAPLLPLLVALFGTALAVRRLVAPNAFALGMGLLLFCHTALVMFMPLRIDHHGWQLAFLILTIAGLADPDPRRGGVTMGLASAASLAIGLELMPFLVIAGAAVVLRWVWQPEDRDRLQRYGVALAIGCAVGFAIFASNANRLPRCDVLSPVWLSAMVAAGWLAFLLPLLSRGDWRLRLGAAGLGGAVLVAGLAFAWPQCLGRPEQISDELARMWFSHIREAKPLYAQGWNTVASVVTLPLIGVVGATLMAWRAWATDRFAVWAPVALVSIVSLALLLWQTRMGPAAQFLAIPGATALIWTVVPILSRHGSVLVRTIGVVAAILVFSGIGTQLVVDRLPKEKVNARMKAINRANFTCPSLRAMRAVAALPATTMFTFVDLGPRLITVTHHRAIAGPYHRNGDAILDVHHAFGGKPEAARAIMRAHGATHLLTCPNMSESTVYRVRDAGGFYDRLAKGERFDWLTPVPLPRGSPLLLWKIG